MKTTSHQLWILLGCTFELQCQQIIFKKQCLAQEIGNNSYCRLKNIPQGTTDVSILWVKYSRVVIPAPSKACRVGACPSPA